MGFARSDRATPAEPSLPLRPRRAACTPNAASRPTTFPPTPACRRAPLGWGPTAQGQLEAAAAIRGHAISPTDAAYEYTVDRHRPPGAGFPLFLELPPGSCSFAPMTAHGMGEWGVGDATNTLSSKQPQRVLRDYPPAFSAFRMPFCQHQSEGKGGWRPR